jgi:hypothetical protein
MAAAASAASRSAVSRSANSSPFIRIKPDAFANVELDAGHRAFLTTGRPSMPETVQSFVHHRKRPRRAGGTLAGPSHDPHVRQCEWRQSAIRGLVPCWSHADGFKTSAGRFWPLGPVGIGFLFLDAGDPAELVERA